MSGLSSSSHTQLRSRRRCTLATAAALAMAVGAIFVAAAPSCAQSNLPSAPTPSSADRPADQQVLPPIGAPSGFTGTTTGAASPSTASGVTPAPHSGADANSEHRHSQRSAAEPPFRIPHTFTKTTDSGMKFQFTLPRIGLHAGNGQMGQASPLDGGSNGSGPRGSGGSSMFPTAFPSADNFMQPSDASSSNAFDTASDSSPSMFPGGRSTGGHAGSGGPGGGRGAGGPGDGGPGVNMKSSVFDLHMGLSMKELGGNFSSNSGSASAGGNSDFGSFGGAHSDGGRGAGPRLSLGLRF